MYKTAEEAREAAKKFVEKRDIPPVIMERKWSKNSRKTWFGFRFFGNETFNPEWAKCTDNSFERMVEVLV